MEKTTNSTAPAHDKKNKTPERRSATFRVQGLILFKFIFVFIFLLFFLFLCFFFVLFFIFHRFPHFSSLSMNEKTCFFIFFICSMSLNLSFSSIFLILHHLVWFSSFFDFSLATIAFAQNCHRFPSGLLIHRVGLSLLSWVLLNPSKTA